MQKEIPFKIGYETFIWLKANGYYAQWMSEVESTQSWAKDNLDFKNQNFTQIKFDDQSLKTLNILAEDLNLNHFLRTLNNHPQEKSFYPLRSTEFKKLSHFYICDYQSRGRGQGQNTWSSPLIGTSLLLSFTIPLQLPPPPQLTLIFGRIVYCCLKECWPTIKFRIKEPNDIYIENNKISGLLTETVSQGSKNYLIFGIGLNIFDGPDLNLIPHSTYLHKELTLNLANNNFNRNLNLCNSQFTISLNEWNNFINLLVTNLNIFI